MPPTPLFLLLLTCLSGICSPLQAQQDAVQPNEEVALFVSEYCIACHGQQDPRADLSLQRFPTGLSINENSAKWELILEMVESEAMPPLGHPQPSEAQRQKIVRQIESRLEAYWKDSQSQTQASRVRRLTNFEYQNTLRDLLGFELQLAKNLPDDPRKPYRFNNTADFMLMGSEQLERYAENAQLAMEAAIVSPERPKVYKARKEWRSERNANQVAIGGNRRGSAGQGWRIKEWPSSGEFRIRLKASGMFTGKTSEFPLRLVMGYGLDNNIGAAPFETVGTIQLSKSDTEPKIYEFRGRIENYPAEPERKFRRGGTRTGRLTTVPAALVVTPQNLFDDGTLNDKLAPETRPKAVIDWIEFEAPLIETWPPKHHRQILFESPLRTTAPDDYVQQVLNRFLARAFRRPLSEQEVQRYFKIFKIFQSQKDSSGAPVSFEKAIRDTLAVALASPGFLYHTDADTHHDYRLANRLSYFLWASMPDEQLFALAEKRKLGNPKIYRAEIERLLDDPRSADFVTNFSRQWLSLDRCTTIPINTQLFPRFLHIVARGERRGAEVPHRPTVRDEMIKETIAFIGNLIQKNKSVTNLVDSEFAMLNQRLAAHYGVEGVSGSRLREVPLETTSHLGGLLTHGSILIGTGTGSAPHPIYRAVWLREAILGEHVKDPPADVPALEDSAGKAVGDATSIQELLRLHRTKESCNVCHARLDPWGIPFENYNAIGEYQPKRPPDGTRTRGFDPKKFEDLDEYREYLRQTYTVPVSAEATLPDGKKINGLTELKAHLLSVYREEIAENVIRRLLSYGLGRPLTFGDRSEVERLVRESRSNEHRMRDMIISICCSELFTGKARE